MRAVELITQISLGLAGGNIWAVKDSELQVAKDCFRGRLALAFDKPEEVLGSALEDTLFREKIYSPEEIIEKIEAVQMEDIRSLAAEIFKKENLSIAVVGDYKKLDFSL